MPSRSEGERSPEITIWRFAVDQRVEGVKKLLLGRILAADELDVVDHQHVDRAEELLEGHHVLVAKGANELVHEFLGREIDDLALGVARADVPGDGVHQVGLAKPDTAVNEQRIEGHGLGIGGPPGRGVSQLVGLADNEIVEREPWIERPADLDRAGADAIGRGRLLGAAGRRFGAPTRQRLSAGSDFDLDGA